MVENWSPEQDNLNAFQVMVLFSKIGLRKIICDNENYRDWHHRGSMLILRSE